MRHSWVVMPQIAGFHDSAHLWYLSDKSSKIHIYATWSKVLKRHSKPNLLFENSVSRCLLGKNGEKAKPLGHGKLATVLITFSFRETVRPGSQWHVDMLQRSQRVYARYVLSSAAVWPNSCQFVFPCLVSCPLVSMLHFSANLLVCRHRHQR